MIDFKSICLIFEFKYILTFSYLNSNIKSKSTHKKLLLAINNNLINNSIVLFCFFFYVKQCQYIIFFPKLKFLIYT